jgi:hypothetical protein
MNAAGSPMLYWLGIAAGILLLSPVAFWFVKRSSLQANPRTWFAVHVAASSAGAVLAVVHTGGRFASPPALLVALLAAVIGLGAWILLTRGSRFAARMAARPAAFGMQDPIRRADLGDILDRKTALLADLDPAAREAEFSLLPSHWLRHPHLAFRYQLLSARERNLIGARRDAGFDLAWSRLAHMALGGLFVAGLAVHFVVATWFPDRIAP